MTLRQEFGRRYKELDARHLLPVLGPNDDPLDAHVDPRSCMAEDLPLEERIPAERRVFTRRLMRAISPEVAPMAEWRPFSGKGTTLWQAGGPEVVCLHTMVGTLSGSWSWANQAGKPYWHFGVGGYGETWQCQDLRYRSASNLEGNDRVIPIETADKGAPFGAWTETRDLPAWTQAQCDAIIELVAWLCVRYNIPPVFVGDSCEGHRGISYHRTGIDPWRQSGCEVWSSSDGKVCPADRRIAQTHDVIIPCVRDLIDGTPPPVEDDLPYTPAEFIDMTRKAVRAEFTANEPEGTTTRTAVRRLTAMGVNDAENALFYFGTPEGGDGEVWVIRADHSGRHRPDDALLTWMRSVNKVSDEPITVVDVPAAAFAGIKELT